MERRLQRSALYALLDRDDENHSAAAAWFAGADDDLLTHNYVVVESAALVDRRLGIVAARALLEDVVAAIRLVFVDESLHPGGRQRLPRPAAPRTLTGVEGQAGPTHNRPTVNAPPWIHRLGSIGALSSDSPEQRLRKTALVLVTLLIVPLAICWVITYASLGLWLSAAIPFAYQVVSLATLAVFAHTKRYGLYRTTQLFMMLILPFLLQWSLGGFGASSAVALWAFIAPLGALVFVGPRGAWPWFAGWVALLLASILLEPALPARHIPHGLVLAFFFLNVAAVSLVCFLLLHYFVLRRDRARDALDREHQLLYMVAGGLPEPIPDHAGAVADLAMRMLEMAGARSLLDGEPVRLRIGIDSGPVVAGVIGWRKFIYDLWGDTVNTASRMESHGLPGRIQVTGRTRDLLCNRYAFEERGIIQIKGKGEMATYLLIARLAD